MKPFQEGTRHLMRDAQATHRDADWTAHSQVHPFFARGLATWIAMHALCNRDGSDAVRIYPSVIG